jgi:hypothetical protein
MKNILIISLASMALVSCGNNSPATGSSSDTATHKPDSAALINTPVKGGGLPDTQLNRQNDSVSRDHTINADTGRKKQ